MRSSQDGLSEAATQDSIRDHLAFFGSLLRRPMRVAAVVPSSKPLARLITDQIDPDGGPVLELGAGTGAFTAELLAKGVPADRIHAVELDRRMARRLSARFPNVQVTVANAAQLSREGLALPEDFAAAVSGLPVLAMSVPDQMRILTGVFRHLRQGGAFYQFTYGPMCPFPALMLARLGLRAQRVGSVMRNLPPASVYRLARRAPPRCMAGEIDSGSAKNSPVHSN